MRIMWGARSAGNAGQREINAWATVRLHCGFLLALMLWVFNSRTMAESNGRPRVSFVDSIGGNMSIAAFYGPYVYVGEGTRLTVFNPNESQSKPVARVQLEQEVQNLCRDGDRLYAGLDRGRDPAVAVFDLADPSRPTLISLTNVKASDYVAAARNRLYTISHGGVVASDFSNPLRPMPVGTYRFEDALERWWFDPVRSRLYAKYKEGRAEVFDLSQSPPASIKQFTILPDIADLAFDDDTLYILSSTRDRLILMSLDDFRTVAEIPLPDRYEAIESTPAGLVAINDDVMDVLRFPAGGVEKIGSLPHQDLAWRARIASSENRVSLGGDGLIVYDVTDPKHIREALRYAAPLAPESLILRDDRLFMADWGRGLKVYRIADADLELMASLNLNRDGREMKFTADGDLLAVNSTNPGTELFDISNPDAPARLASPPELKFEAPFDIAQNIMGFCKGPFLLYDIAALDYPIQVADFSIPEVSLDSICLKPPYAYVGSSHAPGNKVWRLNISDPAHPAMEGSLIDERAVLMRVLSINDKPWFVFQEEEGFRVFWGEEPENGDNQYELPCEFNYGRGGFLSAMAVAGDLLAIGLEDESVNLVDISDPMKPREFLSLPFAKCLALAVNDRYLAVSDLIEGVSVFKCERGAESAH